METGFCGPGLMGAPMIRAAVEQIVFGPAGLLDGGPAAPRRMRWIVDHSSIAPAATRALARRVTDFGEAGGAAAGAAGTGTSRDGASIGWIDAPVSGGVAGATAGTLAIMAGGAASDLAAVRPLLDAYAARVTHMGEVGAGQTAKLCNQAIVTATVAAITEAVSLAQRSGIDAARLPEALAGGSADSVLLRTFVPRMTQSGLAPIGALRTFQKDVDTVAATA
ncbi:3-hydroxyisobutyrate dehydrogenase-like beta-hydroxyacid dehydrogenase [Paraburkholderia sp. 40]